MLRWRWEEEGGGGLGRDGAFGFFGNFLVKFPPLGLKRGSNVIS